MPRSRLFVPDLVRLDIDDNEARDIEESNVLTATQEEIERVTDYMRSQASDLTVEFVQKIRGERFGHPT